MIGLRGKLMKKIGTQTIETERCVLRRIVMEDAEKMFYNWAIKEECSAYFPFDKADDLNRYKELVKTWISNYSDGTYFHWVIEWKENKEVIGTTNLGNVQEDIVMSEMCYILSPAYWGKGIMKEVVQAMIAYAFEKVGLHRIQAEVFEGNIASTKVLEKCGFQLRGNVEIEKSTTLSLHARKK